MLSLVLTLFFLVYLSLAAFFIILENRRPQSTYGWLLAFAFVPVLSVLLYFATGRGWKAFSQERKLVQAALGQDFIRRMSRQLEAPEEVEARLAAQQPRAYHPRLLRLVRRNSASAVSGYNQVEILQDTTEFYPRLLDDLRRAQHHLHLQYYIWTDDEFTRQVQAILIERARAGVKVRILYDAGTRRAMGEAYIEALCQAGVEVLPYLAYNSLRTLHLANYRCHRKITVIDGRVGYLGGMNLDQEQMPGRLWPTWRDTQVRITGDAVYALQAAFLTAWYNTTQERIAQIPGYFPERGAEPLPFLPVQVIMSGPDSQWAAIRQLYFYLIVSARRHVYIQSPFFVPDETIAEALKAAALSGVDVRVICTPRGAKYQVPYRAANTYFQEMAEAGVRIYLYRGGYYHAKAISIDGAICTIGSCNMDVRSYSVNYELNAVIYDAGKAQELEADFRRDLENCSEFDLAEYRGRSVWSRFYDSLCRLTSPLL